MLIIKVRRKIFFATVIAFILLLIGGIFYAKSSFYRNPLMCQAAVNFNSDEQQVKKKYDVYFYLNKQSRALVLVNGFYIGEDGVPLTIRRTLSFNSLWEGNRLVVKNFMMNKSANDNAPDGAIPLLTENDVIQFEMLTKRTYLISTVQSKLACNIRN